MGISYEDRVKRNRLAQLARQLIKQGRSAKEATELLTEMLEKRGVGRRLVTEVVRQTFDEATRKPRKPPATFESLLRGPVFRHLSLRAKFLYMCLAVQHSKARTKGELDARLPTLRRDYGWGNSPAPLRKALAELRKAKLVECTQSAPHSKWARYRLKAANH